jgi:signal-transduction protein with cAMP-binding, CBS, and nucleotidyltransferase domain
VLPLQLYTEIKSNITDAIVQDFNLIREEYDYFKCLPSGLQNEIVDALFGNFKNQFKLFFMQTETGFQNYLITRMYCRTYEPDRLIVNYSERIEQVYFIRQGAVRLYDKTGSHDMLMLPERSWFGDYQSILKLRSNFCIRSKEGVSSVVLMCLNQQVLEEAFELFPRSRPVI